MLRDQRSFQQLLQESDSPMLLLNPQGVVRDINSPAAELLGGKREDYLGKEIFTLVDPADRYFLQEKWRSSNTVARTTQQFTVRMRVPHGRSDWHTLLVETGDESVPDAVRLVRIQHLST